MKRLLAWLAVLGLLPLSAAAQNVTYIHTDALGSPVLETNAQAQVVRQVDYRAYGMDAPRPGPGYTGHYRDVGTGLVYMQQRYYDPVIGRFLSVDPVATNPNTGGSFNRYAYANNNPYRFIDPDGRNSTCTANAQAAAMCASPETAAGIGQGGAAGLEAPRNIIQILSGWKLFNEAAENGGNSEQGSSEPKQVEGWKPGSTGEPGSTEVAGKQSRRYGEDGYPDVDVDTGHDHKGADGKKAGDPHAHDWGRPADGSAPTDRDRGPPRPLREDDPPVPRGRPEVD